ncbi:MAG: hypothetical protein A2Y14_04230 [Verrucomicrobia bacterium GWF2_51_19]|nr:MAG: hypothetical protein A2Y14_04230 [Verrucomicrobia bacterium GWF2_51_19]
MAFLKNTCHDVYHSESANMRTTMELEAEVKYLQREINRLKDWNAHKTTPQASFDEADSRYRKALESFGEAILLVDAETETVVEANPMAETLFGRTKGELVGCHHTQLYSLPPSDGKQVSYWDFCRKQLLNNANIFYREASVASKAGREIPVNVSISGCLFNGRNILIHIFKKETLAENLVKTFTTREPEKPRWSSEAKTDFLSAMNHELRTPLNSIMGMLDVLSDTSLNQEQKDIVKIIKQGNARLLNFIANLIDYNSLENNTFREKKEAFVVEDVVDGALDYIEKQEFYHDLILFSNIDEKCPKALLSDGEKLESMLKVLLENTLLFTRGKQVGILAKTVLDSGKSFLQFEINNSNIIQAKIDYLLKTFVDASDTSVRQYGASFLGFAMAKKLVESLKGKIWLDNATKNTLNIFIRVPVEETLESSYGIRRKRSNAAVVNHRLGESCPLKILVAEDDILNQRVLLTLLKRLGYNDVTLVSNGTEVLEQTKIASFDLILMDLFMPLLDGFSAAERIFESHVGKDRPSIYALTSDTMPETRSRCFKIGMQGYLTKPFSLLTLQEVLQGVKNPLKNS